MEAASKKGSCGCMEAAALVRWCGWTSGTGKHLRKTNKVRGEEQGIQSCGERKGTSDKNQGGVFLKRWDVVGGGE